MSAKTLSLIITLIMVPAILVSCNNSKNFSPEFSLDAYGTYTGFEKMKELESIDEAGPAGYVAVKGQTLVSNSSLWDNFLSESSIGNDASVRIAYFYNDFNSFAADLFYENGKYFLFDNSADKLTSEGYDHLLILEGLFGKPVREFRAVILADDESITFEEYMNAMISSDSEVIQSVQPSRLVMFLDPE